MLLFPSCNPEWVKLAVMFINGAMEEKQKRVLTSKRNQMRWKKEGWMDGRMNDGRMGALSLSSSAAVSCLFPLL